MTTAQTDTITSELNEFLEFRSGSPPQLIIYSSNLSPRFTYTCDFIFNRVLRINYILTNSAAEFKDSSLPKLNYSDQKFEEAFQIEPQGLLNETGTRNFEPLNYKENDMLYFFPVKTGDLKYDVLSAVFYFVSRYEEWLPYKKDEHGRFELTNSILFKCGFHKTPLVDHWLKELKQKLLSKFSKLEFGPRKFKFLSTIDVDNVYAYKAKPWYRVGGALAKDVLKGDFKNLGSRLSTVALNKPDPFDAYDLQLETARKYKTPLLYFFLYRNNTKFDRTLDPSHPLFRELIDKLVKNGVSIGIHPSYYSVEQTELLKKEADLLSKNTGQNIIYSRQHYLRFNIKTSPQHLIANGVHYDFTMGFASGTGFRAATTIPFLYYSLEEEKALPLTSVPFAMMDGAFYIYKSSGTEEVKKELDHLIAEIRKVDGLLVTVFHERSFSRELCPGWEELYLHLHQLAAKPQ